MYIYPSVAVTLTMVALITKHLIMHVYLPLSICNTHYGGSYHRTPHHSCISTPQYLLSVTLTMVALITEHLIIHVTH